ncbi:MAG: class I SAM-dependent methyltransferase [Patescibacteria group bacterium]|jgi:2-polyprenyl-3-methyl-5-hydroxy-6-metoxy-1,4-benzoquinol methylase
MLKNNEELKKILLAKGLGSSEGNLRIFNKFFKDRQTEEQYIHQRFKIDHGLKVLDIGCGYGHDLIHFSEDSVGLEAAVYQADYARSLGLKVVSGNAEEDLNKISGQFDLIWCADFLVHMISPYKFLYDSRRLLPVGGKLVIQIPLMSIFNKHRSGCHFYAFNKKSLEYLMAMAGYRVLKTSGLIRKKPNWFNFIFEPLLQNWGGNIWVLAEKEETVPVDFSKVYLPAWFKGENK